MREMSVENDDCEENRARYSFPSPSGMAFLLSSLAPPRVAVQRVLHVQRVQRRTVAMSATPRAVPWFQRCVVKNSSNSSIMHPA